MTKKYITLLMICTLFACKIVNAQDQRSNSGPDVFFKSATGKYWTKSQLDSFLLRRNNSRFKLIPQVSGVQQNHDSLIYKYNLTIDDAATDRSNRSWIGQPLPDFSFVDVDGDEIDLGDLKGKAIVINFWFATCLPCIAEMPVLNELKEKYSNSNSNVVFLSMTFEKKSTVLNFLKEHPFNYTAISDAGEYCSSITSLYPLTLFVNKKGIIQSAEHIMPPLYNYEITGRFDELDPSEFEKEINAIK